MSNVTKQKPEMTVGELAEKYANTICKPDTEDKEEFLSDLNSVIRGKLIEFKDYVNNTFCEGNLSNLLDDEDVDEFLAKNGLNNNQ